MLAQFARARSTPAAIAVGLFITTFTAVAAYAPYLPVYYESLGLSLTSIGLLGSAAAISGLVAAPAWGIVADRMSAGGFSGIRAALLAASLLAAASAAALSLSSEPTMVVIAAAMFAMSFAGIGPVLDAHALDLVAANQHRYARLRVWGSVAFVVGSVLVGFLIERTGVRALFIVLVGAMVLGAALASLVRRSQSAPQGASMQPGRPGLRAVLRDRTVMAFILAALVAWSASTAVNGFLSIYLVSLGAPTTLVGIAWALGAVVEIPLMVAFPALAARFGIERLVVFGAAMLLMRVVVLVIAREPMVIAASMALHGAGFAFLLVGGVTYVARHAPAMAAATAQGILSGVIFGLAPAIGPGVAGMVAGAAGLEGMFVVATVASAVGLGAVALAVMGGRASARPGGPSAASAEAR